MLSSLSIITSHIVLLHLVSQHKYLKEMLHYHFQVRKAIKNSSRLSESVKDVLLCGICAFELGCVALEQGVLMEDYGLAIWVRVLYIWVWSSKCFRRVR